MWFRFFLSENGWSRDEVLSRRASESARGDRERAFVSHRTRRARRDEPDGPDGVATPDARARELCRGTCRETVYPSFRHEASRTNHGSFPVARARRDASCGPARLAASEDSSAFFESSRDSGFSDETTTVRGHEGHDVREDEKNEFSFVEK